MNIFWGWNSFEYVTDYGLYGWLAVANGGLSLLFGARNNLFTTIGRVPSSILLMYHRWAGLATVFHATFHFADVSSPWLTTDALKYVMESRRNQVGIMAWCALCIITFTSVNIMRRKLFEIFYYTHFVFIAFAIGAIMHASHGLEFILPGFILWGIDRVIRFRYNFRRIGIKEVTLYDGDVTKLKIYGVAAQQPAMVAWIQIRGVSFLDWHPFTVSSTTSENEVTVGLRGLGGFTRKVQRAVKNHHNEGRESQALKNFRLRVDGPYGVGRMRGAIYPLTVLVAGGIGITPGIGIASYIMQQAEVAGTDMVGCHVHLAWIVKERTHMEWFADELKFITAKAAMPCVHVTFDMTVYVTGKVEFGENSPASKNEQDDPLGPIVLGRPEMSELFQSLRRKHAGLDAMASVCGPRSLVTAVRTAAVGASNPDGIFYVDEESFEF